MLIKSTPFGELVAVPHIEGNRKGIEIYLLRNELAARNKDRINGVITEHENGHLRQRIALVYVIECSDGYNKLAMQTWDKPQYKTSWHYCLWSEENMRKATEAAAGGPLTSDAATHHPADDLAVDTALGVLFAETTGDYLYPGIVVCLRHNGGVTSSKAPFSDNFIVSSQGFLEQQLLLAEAVISDTDEGEKSCQLYVRTWDKPDDSDPFHAGKIESKLARYDIASIEAGDVFVTYNNWHIATEASCQYSGDKETYIVKDRYGTSYTEEDFAVKVKRKEHKQVGTVTFTISKGGKGINVKSKRYESYNRYNIPEASLFSVLEELSDTFNNDFGLGIVFDM